MGTALIDRYSLLHFAVGIIAQFWAAPLLLIVIVHIVFETVENTQWGMLQIRRFPWWPGGKSEADSRLNSFGDTLATAAGWLVAAAVNPDPYSP